MAKPQSRPYVWQMIREAVDSIGRPARLAEIRNWVNAKYPGTNRGTIDTQVGFCCVNVRSRVNKSYDQLATKLLSGPVYLNQFLIRATAHTVSVRLDPVST